LALVVEDPDAPDPAAPQRIFTHWIVYDLPADTGGVDDGIMPDQLPGNAKLGKNDFGKLAWGGPCPPIGQHRYLFKLFALDCSLSDLNTPDRDGLYRAMEGHILEEAMLMGTYEKHRA
jgi:Raf kinase inhibitor-like YbhB/YbcL family protein